MARTKDPQKIPRPCNSFFQFRLAIIEELKSKVPQQDLSQVISRMWHALPQEEKAVYIAKAKKEKEDHAKKYPDYQYRPNRNKKTAIVKIEEDGSPSPSTSRSSSLASSSASTPAPTTPDTTIMLPVGPSSSRNAFDFNSKFGEDFVLNHPVLPGAHAIGLPHASQPYGHSWSPQIAGWTEPPPLPSASTAGLHRQSDACSFLPNSAETAQGLFLNPYAYQPHASFAPPQALPAQEARVQLSSGFTGTQSPQPALQQAVNQVLLTLQAHTGAPQPRTEPLFSSGRSASAEPEAWNKEFAPLDAGFCDFLSAWTNIKASASASTAASPSVPSSTCGATSTSASLPSAAVYDLDVSADNHDQELPSQAEDPLAFPSASDLFDASFMSPWDPLYGQLSDPFQDLPPSAVWPEALNPLGIWM